MARTYYFKDDEESKRYFENERKMKENHSDWHYTEDPVKKEQLEFDSKRRAGENDLIDGGNRTFDEDSGVWSVDYGSKTQSSVPWKNEQENKYVSPYNDEINALYDEIVNQKSFSYNPENDASYKAYENMYRREGDRASKSTLADVATAQGGVSSYAASAAQQASNAYAQALTDKIPELEALAYQKYAADRNDKYNQLNSLMALDNTAYGRYSDDWNRNYQLARDKVNDEWLQKNFDNNNYWNQVNLETDIWKTGIGVDQWRLNRVDNNHWNGVNYDMQKEQMSQSQYDDKFNQLMGLADDGVISYQTAMAMLDLELPEVNNSSNGNSGGKGGRKSSVVKTEISEEKNNMIEEVLELLEEGYISEAAAKNRIDRIKAGLNPTFR